MNVRLAWEESVDSAASLRALLVVAQSSLERQLTLTAGELDALYDVLEAAREVVDVMERQLTLACPDRESPCAS
jgi:predicted transcriptional regulator